MQVIHDFAVEPQEYFLKGNVFQRGIVIYLENMPDYFHILLCPGEAWLFTLKICRKIFIYCCVPKGHGGLS